MQSKAYDTDDVKSVDQRALEKAFRLMKINRPLVGGRGKASEVKLLLGASSTLQTVAGTNLNTIVSIIPGSYSEYASFAALWDEIIVDSGRIDFTSTVTTNFTTNNGINRAVVAFDPIENAVLGNTQAGMQHSQHLQFQPASSGTAITTPQVVTPHGIQTFAWKTPRGSARAAGSATIFGHDWSPTSETTNTYGYLKWYVPVSGATGVVTFDYTITLHVRVRCRT